MFKTPGLRDLNHSGPYGQFSDLANGGFVRNADARLLDINLVFSDIAPLVAFLRSLNEDYE